MFDYAAFQGHAGAALWFVALIKLVLSLATSALVLTIIRQLFATGIFNSAAGLAMVVGGVGAATVIASVAGGAGGTPQVAIAAAAQGANVAEGSPAVFVISAVPEPEQPLIVSITVAQTGSYVDAANIGSKTVTVPTSGQAQFTIPTEDDDADNAAGIGDRNRLGRMRITTSASPRPQPWRCGPEDDEVYQVSIAPSSPGLVVEEGNLANFVISSDPPPEEPLVVSITVAQSGGVRRLGQRGQQVGEHTDVRTCHLFRPDRKRVGQHVGQRERYRGRRRGLRRGGPNVGQRVGQPRFADGDDHRRLADGG